MPSPDLRESFGRLLLRAKRTHSPSESHKFCSITKLGRLYRMEKVYVIIMYNLTFNPNFMDMTVCPTDPEGKPVTVKYLADSLESCGRYVVDTDPKCENIREAQRVSSLQKSARKSNARKMTSGTPRETGNSEPKSVLEEESKADPQPKPSSVALFGFETQPLLFVTDIISEYYERYPKLKALIEKITKAEAKPALVQHGHPRVEEMRREWASPKVFEDLVEVDGPENATPSVNSVKYYYSTHLQKKLFAKKLLPFSREAMANFVGAHIHEFPAPRLVYIAQTEDDDEGVCEWLFWECFETSHAQQAEHGPGADLYQAVVHRRLKHKPVYTSQAILKHFFLPFCHTIHVLKRHGLCLMDRKLDNFLKCMGDGMGFSPIDLDFTFPYKLDSDVDCFTNTARDPFAALGKATTANRRAVHDIATCCLHLFYGYMYYDIDRLDSDIDEEFRLDRVRSFETIARLFDRLDRNASEQDSLFLACMCNAVVVDGVSFEKLWQYGEFLIDYDDDKADPNCVLEDLRFQRLHLRKNYQSLQDGEAVKDIVREYQKQNTKHDFIQAYAKLHLAYEHSSSAMGSVKDFNDAVETLKNAHSVDMKRVRDERDEIEERCEVAEAKLRAMNTMDDKIKRLEAFIEMKGHSLEEARAFNINRPALSLQRSVSSCSASSSSSSSSSRASATALTALFGPQPERRAARKRAAVGSSSSSVGDRVTPRASSLRPSTFEQQGKRQRVPGSPAKGTLKYQQQQAWKYPTPTTVQSAGASARSSGKAGSSPSNDGLCDEASKFRSFADGSPTSSFKNTIDTPITLDDSDSDDSDSEGESSAKVEAVALRSRSSSMNSSGDPHLATHERHRVD